MHFFRPLLPVFVLATLVCCGLAAGPVSSWSGEARLQKKVDRNYVWYRLHFGLGNATPPLAKETVYDFIDKNLTPVFSDGFTITESRGQWMAPEGLVKENTIVVDVQCEDTEANWQSVTALARAYVDGHPAERPSCYIKRIPGITSTLVYGHMPQ